MTPASSLIQLDASTLAAKTRSGEVTVTDVAEAIAARIGERDPLIHAFAFFDADLLMQQAAQLDASESRGPLFGVPVAVKDVINTKDMPTAHNTLRYQGSRPGVDAACVDTLRNAGALIVGKTVTTEFATTVRGGPTRNPHDTDRTPGGSSSGSGAAVADFQSALALGTQTAAQPSVPPLSAVCSAEADLEFHQPRRPENVFSHLRHAGLYARSAKDLALLADVFALDEAEHPLPVSLEGLRIGLCRSPAWPQATSVTESTLSAGSAALAAAGAKIVDLPLPTSFDGILDAHRKILRREGRSAFLNEYLMTPDLHEDFKAIVENRDGFTPAETRAAYRLADQCRAEFEDIAAGFDIILTPSAIASTAWHRIDRQCHIQLDVDAVAGTGRERARIYRPEWPAGRLSLVGGRYQDRRVIALAGLAETAFARAVARAAA